MMSLCLSLHKPVNFADSPSHHRITIHNRSRLHGFIPFASLQFAHPRQSTSAHPRSSRSRVALLRDGCMNIYPSSSTVDEGVLGQAGAG
jgi:hypothetical protein